MIDLICVLLPHHHGRRLHPGLLDPGCGSHFDDHICEKQTPTRVRDRSKTKLPHLLPRQNKQRNTTQHNIISRTNSRSETRHKYARNSSPRDRPRSNITHIASVTCLAGEICLFAPPREAPRAARKSNAGWRLTRLSRTSRRIEPPRLGIAARGGGGGGALGFEHFYYIVDRARSEAGIIISNLYLQIIAGNIKPEAEVLGRPPHNSECAANVITTTRFAPAGNTMCYRLPFRVLARRGTEITYRHTELSLSKAKRCDPACAAAYVPETRLGDVALPGPLAGRARVE
ncbi:hypothetical protein EDC01DRAFT_627642 [Geopyxis carbonaria]|nr:hypothetical protein EDC01DRAFT_627642 [Geopyxis carbonaria]